MCPWRKPAPRWVCTIPIPSPSPHLLAGAARVQPELRRGTSPGLRLQLRRQLRCGAHRLRSPRSHRVRRTRCRPPVCRACAHRLWRTSSVRGTHGVRRACCCTHRLRRARCRAHRLWCSGVRGQQEGPPGPCCGAVWPGPGAMLRATLRCLSLLRCSQACLPLLLLQPPFFLSLARPHPPTSPRPPHPPSHRALGWEGRMSTQRG